MKHPGSITRVALVTALDILGADVPARRIRTLIWHHFWRPRAKQYKGGRTMRGVRGNHRRTRGWRDVGYNWLYGPNGDVWTGRSLVSGSGAHTRGHNSDGVGLGMCLDGDTERLDQLPAMQRNIVAMTAALCRVHGLDQFDIYGHSAFASKSCPGKLVPVATKYRELVAAELGVEVRPKWVRLKLSDGSTYNLVPDLPLVNAGGSIVAEGDFELELGETAYVAKGHAIREVLEEYDWQIAAWHGDHGPSGTIYSRRKAA